MQTVNFIGYKCLVKVSRYDRGISPCLRLVDTQGMPVATATVNVPELQLPPDFVVIKNYAENEGILPVLIAAQIVQPTGQTVPIGTLFGRGGKRGNFVRSIPTKFFIYYVYVDEL